MNIDIKPLLKNPVAIVIALLLLAALFFECGLGFIGGAFVIGAVIYGTVEAVKAME